MTETMKEMEAVDVYETQLEAAQVDWVKKWVEARYERSLLVNAPLIGMKGIPEFPPIEAVVKSALKQLTREQVAYMMGKKGQSSFSFHLKLVTPSSRLDLQKRLINGQPKRMDTPKQKQQDLSFYDKEMENYLYNRPSSRRIEWQWEFVQGEQLIKERQEGEEVNLTLKGTIKQVRQSRPRGMRGIDRYSWASLMADSLERGKPLDTYFKDDTVDTTAHLRRSTVLDEEGEYWVRFFRFFLITGTFDPSNRRAELGGHNGAGKYVAHQFANRFGMFSFGPSVRSSVSGPIEKGWKKKSFSSVPDALSRNIKALRSRLSTFGVSLKSEGLAGGFLKSLTESNKLRVAAAVLLGGTVGAKAAGTYLAMEAIEKAQVKLAIAAYVDNGAKKDQAIGYIFGGSTRVKSLGAVDNSIPIDPGEMEKNGGLYYWYHAMITLEDKGHDGGFSDFTGINPRMPLSVALGGGGSSLADQACGALRDGISEYQYQKLGYYPGKVLDKAEETLCGIGLAGIRSPQEIAAYYATYQYIAPSDYGVGGFIQKHWGISDVEDLKIGQQLLLAAFFNLPWNGSDEGWEKNQRRAFYALDQLVESGVIPKKKEGDVRREIINSRPELQSDYKDIAPKRGYNTGMGLAVSEAKTYFGDDFRSELRSIHTTLDPSVLTATYWACENTLVEINNDLARCVILAVDSSTGEIIAMDSRGHGDQFGFNRFFTERSPGSMGKILLAAGAGNRHLSPPPGNPYSSAFYNHLSRSSSAIIDDAKAMKISRKIVGELIDCYGTPHEDAEPLEAAGMGMFETSPFAYIQTLYEAHTGKPSPNPYVVSAFADNDGEVHKIQPIVREDGEDCATLTYADGYTESWLKAPLDSNGTLSILSGIADIGKTGTVGSRGSSGNSMVWAIAGKAYPDGHFYTVLAGFGSDDNQEIMGLGTGGDVAGPAVREILLSIDKRKRQKAL